MDRFGNLRMKPCLSIDIDNSRSKTQATAAEPAAEKNDLVYCDLSIGTSSKRNRRGKSAGAKESVL